MSETAPSEPARKEFIVKMKSPWTALAIPIVATLYVGWVVLLASGKTATPGIPLVQWVYGGLALLVVLLFWGWLLTLRRSPRVKKAKAKKVKAQEPVQELQTEDLVPEETAAPVSIPVRNLDRPYELVYAGEEYKGRQVLEISIPPKSANRGAVYTKTYVPVAEDLVVRVEDLAEDANRL